MSAEIPDKHTMALDADNNAKYYFAKQVQWENRLSFVHPIMTQANLQYLSTMYLGGYGCGMMINYLNLQPFERFHIPKGAGFGVGVGALVYLLGSAFLETRASHFAAGAKSWREVGHTCDTMITTAREKQRAYSEAATRYPVPKPLSIEKVQG